MTLYAADVMTRSVVSAQEQDSIATVAKLLAEHNISAVPVCDEHGTVTGMVSEGDLMRPFGKAHAMKRAWWLNLLAEGTTLAPAFLDYIRLNRQCARDIMVSPAVIAPETASVATIADLLAQHRIKRVPIMRDKTMVGIVSRADIVRAMARMPQDDLADF